MKNKTAAFLLKVPPLEELTDKISEIVEQYRYNIISEDRAIDILTTKYSNVIEAYAKKNIELQQIVDNKC